MTRAGNWIFASLILSSVFASPTLAVTVDVDVVSNGEPVPGATITFETETGVIVPAASPPSTAVQEAAKPAQGMPAVSTISSVLPEDVVGKPLTAVISKDGKVVKRHPVTVTDHQMRVSVEAYDPADAALSLAMERPEGCAAPAGCDLGVVISNDGNGIYEGPVFVSLQMPGLEKFILPNSGSWQACAGKKDGGRLCRLDVSLEPLKRISVRLPLHPGESKALPSRVCASLLQIDAEGDTSKSLMMTLQLGLVLKGADIGPIDGRAGPRTVGAITALGLPAEAEPAQSRSLAFEKLFGREARVLSRLRVEGDEVCVALLGGASSETARQRPATSTPPKPMKKATANRPTTKQKPKPSKPKASKRSTGGIGLDVEIGIGIGGDLSHHKKKHKADDEFKD